MLSKGVFLLAVLSVGAIAVFAEEDDWADAIQNDEAPTATQCAVSCPVSSSSSKFGYEPGNTYLYRYESDIKTSVPGTTMEHSSLHMRANVQIEVISTCEMLLRLTDVALQDSNPTNFESRQHVEQAVAFRRGLQTRTMSFSFIDGKIETICPDANDEIWAINIKRGILSTLQNTMTSLQGANSGREVDVSGNCPVIYEQVNSGWGSRTVKKTKDLLGCTDRQAGQTVFQAIQYDAASDIQSVPLMKSTHSCEQEIGTRERIISKTTCSEVHMFRPFAQENSGATTEVTYKLEFQSKREGISSQQAISRSRTDLLYDHRLTDEEMADTVREARTSLTELCSKTEVDVRPEAPSVFNRLVKQMRKLDGTNLKRLHTATKSGLCGKAEKYFRDALPVLGTTGGVIVMRDLMTQGQADNAEIDRWLTSIAFISNPTPDMMRELQSLLTSDFDRSSLPVSSLINTYCQLYNEDESPEVQQMVKTMEDALLYNCRYETEAQRSRIIKALKAIGNAGNADRIAPTLNRCVANNDLPVSMRVAAITAFRRLSCTADRGDLIRLMENKQADSELRIMAYLAVMQCANEDTINRVKTVLESDEVNQVGSFIWTHLTNLQETSCPMKSDIKDLLKDITLSKTYDLDKRKFSRNIELSGFSEIFNIGALVESNLIWSSQSYIPRSASANITIDVFGQSINLLEFGGRVQGVESILERFFATKDSENAIRERRAIIRDEQMNIIDTKFPKARDDLALSYYMRVFGNEIRSGEINDFDFEGLKNRFNFLNWMIMLAQENRIDVTKNFLFLDSTLTVPTGVGIPLRLSVEGTATVSLTASGKADIRQLFSSPTVFDINGSIRPSAAIEIKGEMGVDAQIAKTGLKTVNRLHTSTLLDGKIQLQDGKLFNLDLNLPQEKVEIFSAESHVYVTYRGLDREQENFRPGGLEKKECTGQKIAYIFGVELCGEVSLDGPLVAKAYVNKKDTYTGFHFEAGYRQNRAEMTDSVRISMSTPGSRIDREITTDFKLDRANSQVEMNLKSPWKKVNAQASLVNSAALKRAILQATIDETAVYSLNAEVQIDNKPQEIRYVPTIRVNYPDNRGQVTEITFDGTVVYTRGKKMAVNVSLRNAFQQPISIDGTVEKKLFKKASKYDTNIQFNSQFVKGSLAGFVSNSQENGNAWSSRADLSYQVAGGRNKERIVINHKFRDLSSNNLRSYSTDCSWTSTVHPRLNGQIGLELSFSPNSLRTKIEAGLDNVKKVTIVQSGAFDFSGTDKKINGMLKFELPYKNWDYEVKLDHIHNWDTLQSNATVKYSEEKQMTLDIGLKKDNSRFLQLAGEAFFRMPNVDMSITHRLTERAPREYHGELNLQGIPKIGNARATTLYKMSARHEFSADINVAGYQPVSMKGHLKPTLKDLQARGEFSYGNRNYMADINWLHRGTGAAFNTKANIEVAYLGRSKAITVEVSRRNQEFSTNAELKLAEDKKFSLSSQITATLTEPKIQVRIEWPDNFMAVAVIGKYETKGWYTTTSDLEGSIQFTSSIPRLEQLGASFHHDLTSKSMKTNGELSWAADKKITGEFFYDKNKITLDIATPFVGYQTIKGEAAYTPKGRMFGHTTKISWESNQVILAITGEYNSPSVTGKITFTSPFKGFESLSTSLRHVVSGNKYTTNADVTWARGQQVMIALNMDHNRNGWSVTNNGDVTVQTPFRGYRVTKLTWTHQNDDSMWKCRHEFELDRQKYILGVDATHGLSRGARQLTATAFFQSPIQGFEDLRFSGEYRHDLRGIKSSGKSSVSWGPNSVTHEHNVIFVPYTSLIVKGKVTTPFRGFESVGIDMNNRRSGNTFTAANELNLGRYGTGTLAGTLTYQGYNLDANIHLTTPSRILERVAATLKNSKEDDVWMSRASFEYAPDKSYSVDTKLGWESQKKVELQIKTPHQYMRSMKFNAGVTGSLRNFQISSELEHNAIQDKITFLASVDTQNTRSMNGRVTVSTPFSQLSNFKVTADHTRQTAQSCLTTGSYEFNNIRGSLNHQMTVRSWTDFNTKTEIEYVTGRKLELTTALSSQPTITGSATFRSPFPKARELGMTFSHEGPSNNFKSQLELSYNRRDKINANAEITLLDNRVRIYSRLTTPFQSFERSVLEINHVGSPNNYQSDASFEFNDKKVATSSQLTFEGEGFRLTSRLETPFRSVREATVSMSHSGNWRRFNNNVELTYDGSRISATSEFNLEGPTGKFTLRTPFTTIQTVNFNFAHETKNDRQGKGWSNSATFELNNSRYTGSSELLYTGRQLRAKATVNIPQEYSIVLQHRGDSIKDYSNSVTLKMNDQTITGSSSFKYSPSLIDAKTTVETTFRGYNKFEAIFKHEGPVNDFKTRASISTPFSNFRSYATELTYNGNPNDFTSSFIVSNPAKSLLTINANHRYTGRSLNSGIAITTTDQPMSASVSYQKDGSTLDASAKLQTPYSGYENFETIFRFSGVANNFRTSATVTTPFSGYERFAAELNHAGSWNRFETSGKFEMTSASPVSFSIEHSSPDAWRINTKVEVLLPAGKIGVTFTNTGAPGNFRSGLKVTTPYRGYTRFETNLEHEGGLNTPKSKLTVVTPFRGYNNFQLSGEKSGSLRNLQLKAELTTPIRSWERTAASWSHNVDNTVQLNGQIETSVPGLDKVTGSLTHNGAADNFQTVITLETPIQGYERQTITINHSSSSNIRTTATVETSVPGYTRFSGNFDYTRSRRGIKSSASIETSIRGYDRFTANMEINYIGATNFGGSIQVQTPIQGFERFGATFNHNGDLSQFESTAKITTPLRQIPLIEATLKHRGQITDFNTGLKVEYSGKTIEAETSFKRIASRYDSRYEGNLKINSPCPFLRDVNIIANHVRQTDVKTGALDVTYNGEKKVDFDYRYTTSGDRQIDINIRNPYTMSTTLNMNGNDGQAVINWDTTRQDSQVRFDFGYKDTSTSELSERSIRFKVTPSRRTIGFEFGYSLSADRFTHKGDLQWDSDPESEIIYEIEASKTATRNVYTYDGKVKVTSGLMTTTSTFSHKTQVRRKHTTELVIETTERLRLSNELVMTPKGFVHTFIAQHPRLTQEVNINTEVTQEDTTKGIKTTVKYERQAFTIEGQITDESQSGSLRSSGTFRFAHPNSGTDTQLTGTVYNDYEKAGLTAEFQHQISRDRSMQTASIKTELNKTNKEFSLELAAPFDRLRLAAKNRFPDNTNGMYGYELSVQTNEINMKAVSVVSCNDKSVDAKFYFTESDYIQVFAQAGPRFQSKVELSRFFNNRLVNDITANLSISDERLLTGYAFIRPNLRDDFRSSLRPDRLYPRDLAANSAQWIRTINDDWYLKRQRLHMALTPISNAAWAVANDINAKVEQAKAEFNVMYNRNEFYIRDIHLALQRAANQISENLAELKRSYDAFYYRTQRYITYYNRKVQQRLEELNRRTAEYFQDVAIKFSEMKTYCDNAMSSLRADIEEFFTAIRNHPKVRAMIEKLNSIEVSDFLPPSDWQQRLTAFYNNLKARFEEAMSRPELRELRDWFITRVEETIWMYEYFGYREQVALWIEQARSFTWQTFKAKAMEYVEETLQLSKNRWTMWDVRSGQYGFQLYIPIDPLDLSILQRLNLQKYIDYVSNIIAQMIPDEEWSLIDTIFAYWPSNDVYNWIPPFKSHASITGSQHFITFDHKSYEFAGECSYLLTRDFVDKSFSVVVNYDKMTNNRPVRKSITVLSDGKQIEVFADAKVTVDGVRSEMPIRVVNTTVSRTGNAIRVDSDRGFSVVCDLAHDHCSISVSGWYYNKMAGLLGTYDNEPSNDMTTIDNTITDRPEQLAYSWIVGQKCRPNNRAITQPARPDSKAYEICAQYFTKKSGSLFRSCHRVVDPEQFLQMCINDMQTDDESVSEADMCNVAAAYIQECRLHDVQLRMPRSCVRCEVPDSADTYLETDSFRYSAEDPAPKAADVVFIVQHSQCNKDVLDKVKGLVDDLEKAMKAEGLTNTRYAIVGFGGKDHLAAPHTHTMDSQIFNSANKVAQGMSKFDLEAGVTRDPMAAVRFAAKMSFRPGASKTFILLACDKCFEETIRYRDLQRALLESDVKLHVLVPEIIKLKSKSAKTAYIFGVDKDTVYTRQDVAGDDLRGEPDLRRYVVIPKDLCVALTQDTSGSIFSSRQWLDSRPIIQKRFSDVMVRTFARKAQPTECQECECVADEYGAGYTRCSSCSARMPYYGYYPTFEEDDAEVPSSVPESPVPQPQTPVPNKTKDSTPRPQRPSPTPRNPRPTQRRPPPRPPRPTRVAPQRRPPANPNVRPRPQAQG